MLFPALSSSRSSLSSSSSREPRAAQCASEGAALQLHLFVGAGFYHKHQTDLCNLLLVPMEWATCSPAAGSCGAMPQNFHIPFY